VTIDVVLLTQKDCAFCDQAHEILTRLQSDFTLNITTLDIASEDGIQMASEGGVMFAPGLFVDGKPFSYGRPSERKLRKRFHALTRIPA
jgi:glutaredoxin